MCDRRQHPVPGKRLNSKSFDYNLVIRIPDPNNYIKAASFLKELKEIIEEEKDPIDFLIETINLSPKALLSISKRLRKLPYKDAYKLLNNLTFFSKKLPKEVLNNLLGKIRDSENETPQSDLKKYVNLTREDSKKDTKSSNPSSDSKKSSKSNSDDTTRKKNQYKFPTAQEFLDFIIDNRNKKEMLIKRLNNQFIARNMNNIEERFSEIYCDYKSSSDSENLVVQPTIGALRATRNCKTNIYTNIFFYENFLHHEFRKKDFNIYQNFEMGPNDQLQLTYYVCFLRTGLNKKRGDTYRMHKFSIKNEDIKHIPFEKKNSNKKNKVLLNMDEIDEVMAFVINVNPEASRGTSTKVKDVN